MNVPPRLALGPSLRADVGLFDHVFGRLGASFFPEQHARAGSGDVAFGLTLGSLGACYRAPLSGVWSLSGCATALLGNLDVTVHSPTPLAPGARTWLAGSASAVSALRFGAAEISLEIAALDHFSRHTYLIDRASTPGADSIFVEPTFGALATLGAGVRF